MTTVSPEAVTASVRVQIGDGAPLASVTAYVYRAEEPDGTYGDWYEWLVTPSVALALTIAGTRAKREPVGSHHVDRWAEGVDYGRLRAALGAPERAGTCRRAEEEAA